MTVTTLPDANLTLGALFRRPYERMVKWVYEELARSGFDDVRPSFSAVLRHLPREGARVSDLAAAAGMAKQSMAYLVEQMAAVGLVELVPDPTDRRAKTVRLTARGVAAGVRAVELSAIYERHLASLLGARKMAVMRRILVEIHARLESDTDSAPPPVGR